MILDPEPFIRANAAIESPPLLPEIRLYLANEVTPLWQATEETLAQGQVPPPFWAFAWAGGQALARHVLDLPETVAGRTVLDFAAGSGLVGIAAAMAGAARVTAAETDPFAAAAIRLNAGLNAAALDIVTDDLLDAAPPADDVILAGDVCYERPMAERAIAWLRLAARQGNLVLLGDPGRAYLPPDGLVELARYQVPVSREVEDRELRDGAVYQVLAS